MYTYYTANSTWVMSEVLSDMHALATGSDIASLSASCNKPLSYQSGSVAAGWTSHDTATAQTTVPGYVISAADADNLSTKYLNFWGSSSTVISFRGMEAWDAGANTATNATTTQTITLTASTAFVFRFFITPRYYVVQFGAGAGMLSLEVLRDSPPMASNATMPLTHCVGLMGALSSTSGGLLMPRIKSPSTGATLTAGSAAIQFMTIATLYSTATTGYNQSASAGPQYKSDGTQYIPVKPLYLGYLLTDTLHVTYLGRVAGTDSDYPLITNPSLTGAVQGDEITINGTVYIMVVVGAGLLMPVK